MSDKSIQDEETKGILFQGASVSQLAALFKIDKREVTKKLVGVDPIGKRGGFAIYAVDEAARHIVDPIYDIDMFIARMTHQDLPPLLRKEFWSAMRSRQLYEKEAGDLWPTETIVEHLSEVFKTLKTSILLMGDAVDRETELTERQRSVIQSLIDGALSDLNESIKINFSKQKRIVDPQEIDTEDL